MRDPIPGMNGEDGFGDSFLTRHNEQRFLLQLGFVDRQLGALIRRLRRAGLYDRALIVVTADHGGSFETGVRSRRKITHGNVDEVGPVPLFVKRPGQRRGRTSRALVRTLDVMPTIADVVNAPDPLRHRRALRLRRARPAGGASCASPRATSAARSRSRGRAWEEAPPGGGAPAAAPLRLGRPRLALHGDRARTAA